LFRFFGKARKKRELIANLPALFRKVQDEHMVSASDIPPIESIQEKLAGCDFTKFPPLREKLIAAVDAMLTADVASLVAIVPQDTEDR
jgi:hypothetical protein